jgi:hypothetical protein
MQARRRTMPTNETFLEWGICPRCEYHIIVEDTSYTIFKGPVWKCARCEFAGFGGFSNEFLPLDTLQQMFAEWKLVEFELFMASIVLCAEAKRRGVAGSLAGYRGYTTQSINRLAALENLPEYLLDPELPNGIYWQALLMSSDGDNVDLDKFAELVGEAIVNSWSLKEFKEHHGIVGPDRRQPVFDGVAELVQTDEYQWKNVEVKVY